MILWHLASTGHSLLASLLHFFNLRSSATLKIFKLAAFTCCEVPLIIVPTIGRAPSKISQLVLFIFHKLHSKVTVPIDLP